MAAQTPHELQQKSSPNLRSGERKQLGYEEVGDNSSGHQKEEGAGPQDTILSVRPQSSAEGSVGSQILVGYSHLAAHHLAWLIIFYC